jgi:hypothetical protein
VEVDLELALDFIARHPEERRARLDRGADDEDVQASQPGGRVGDHTSSCTLRREIGFDEASVNAAKPYRRQRLLCGIGTPERLVGRRRVVDGNGRGR